MKKKITTILSAAVAVMLPVAASQAQTAGFLDVNPDPVAMSMAGAGTVLDATPYAMWNNIASTALGEQKFQIGASYSLWQPSFSSNNVAAVAGYGRVTKFMTISAGVKYFSYPSMDITDGTTGVVTGTFAPMELQAGIGLGFKVLPILSLGVNVNYVHSDIGGPKKGGAVAGDFGAMLDLKFLRVGLTAANIGSKLNYGGASSYNLPANVKLGVGTVQNFGDDKKHGIAVNLQGGMTFKQSAFFAELGAQYVFNDLFRVGVGYHYGDQDKLVAGSYASVGAGIKLLGISVNAAYLIGLSENSPIGNTFSVGLGYSF